MGSLFVLFKGWAFVAEERVGESWKNCLGKGGNGGLESDGKKRKHIQEHLNTFCRKHPERREEKKEAAVQRKERGLTGDVTARWGTRGRALLCTATAWWGSLEQSEGFTLQVHPH